MEEHTMSQDTNLGTEKYITMKQAAFFLGLPYWKIQRAVKAGQLPSYQLFNSRRLVRLSEVEASIQQSGATQG
jgi:excisionase family DNA binding protein